MRTSNQSPCDLPIPGTTYHFRRVRVQARELSATPAGRGLHPGSRSGDCLHRGISRRFSTYGSRTQKVGSESLRLYTQLERVIRQKKKVSKESRDALEFQKCWKPFFFLLGSIIARATLFFFLQQDVPGGGFSKNQAFSGQIADVGFWEERCVLNLGRPVLCDQKM